MQLCSQNSIMITNAQLEHAISFKQYMDLAQEIINSTTPPAPYNEPKMFKYASDNVERMKRLVNNIAIEQKLYNLLSNNQQKMIWVVLTEPWCGDASQIVPALAAFADISEHISFKILLRDSNLEVMDAYLTNGGRSIPKLICLNAETGEELGTWGPRPQSIQKIVMEQKNDPTTSFGEKVRQIHAWYEENKTRDIQLEFIELLKQWNNIQWKI